MPAFVVTVEQTELVEAASAEEARELWENGERQRRRGGTEQAGSQGSRMAAKCPTLALEGVPGCYPTPTPKRPLAVICSHKGRAF